MSTWASRRKGIYFWSVVLVLTAISFSIFWNFWYKAPTCSDNLQNGDETGIDCGGSCSLICSAQAMAPIIRSDPRIFRVMDNMYSVVAFIENHNIDLEAKYVPYVFKVYDSENKILYERKGSTLFPKNRTTAVFEGNILIPNAIPKRAEIELGKIVWQKNTETDPEIEIKSSALLKEDTSPRIEAEVVNKSIENLRNIELVAVVYDGKSNAIAASRTFVNRIDKNSSSEIFFTWPKPFDLGETVCSLPSRVVLAIDRSGSMSSISKNPPEPFTSVKTAAGIFVSELSNDDAVGVVSFATNASNPPDSLITSDLTSVKNIISNLSIDINGTQFTNISDAIAKSISLFASSTAEIGTQQKVLVLLTDGVATRPINPQGSKNEAEEILYAENEAEKQSQLAKQQQIVIYTIGLGNEIHESFLTKIASAPENYYKAPNALTLTNIYKDISSSICKEVPARIEITHKIFGDTVVR